MTFVVKGTCSSEESFEALVEHRAHVSAVLPSICTNVQDDVEQNRMSERV